MTTPRRLPTATESLQTAEQRIHKALTVLPGVLDNLAERRAHAGTREANETGITSNALGNPTANRGVELAYIAHQSQDIANAARMINTAIDLFDEACRRSFSRNADTYAADPPQCAGYPTGHECYDSPGYEWQGNTIVTRANRLCDACNLERGRDERREAKALSARQQRHGKVMA